MKIRGLVGGAVAAGLLVCAVPVFTQRVHIW
jgi:hypothetical protein